MVDPTGAGDAFVLAVTAACADRVGGALQLAGQPGQLGFGAEPADDEARTRG